LKSQNGAFQLFKAACGGVGSRILMALSSSSSGYTVAGLKEEVKSSTIYIVPLNSKISTEPMQINDLVNEDVEVVVCSSCNNEIPLLVFRNHKKECQKGIINMR